MVEIPTIKRPRVVHVRMLTEKPVQTQTGGPMTEERSIAVTVESVGTITWGEPLAGSDVRWNESEPVARVIDAEKNRYIVTGRMCFRNGTTISPDIVGLKGIVEVYRFSPFSFNCPTMFGKPGL